MVKQVLEFIFKKKKVHNSKITPVYSSISKDIELYGDIPAFRKANEEYTDDSFDGGTKKKEKSYKRYKSSIIFS